MFRHISLAILSITTDCKIKNVLYIMSHLDISKNKYNNINLNLICYKSSLKFERKDVVINLIE